MRQSLNVVLKFWSDITKAKNLLFLGHNPFAKSDAEWAHSGLIRVDAVQINSESGPILGKFARSNAD